MTEQENWILPRQLNHRKGGDFELHLRALGFKIVSMDEKSCEVVPKEGWTLQPFSPGTKNEVMSVIDEEGDEQIRFLNNHYAYAIIMASGDRY